MAKKNVVEIICDRCDRTEYISPQDHYDVPDLVVQFGCQPASAQSANAKAVHEPEISARFEDLCSSCKKAVKNLMEQATRKINWRRGRAEDELEDKKGKDAVPSP